MKACLTDWFQNPKDLHLTDPRMTYPFNFEKWKKLSYQHRNTVTYVLKDSDWIIGMASLSIDNQKKNGHLFHVFIEPGHRNRSYGNKLVQFLERTARNLGMKTLSLWVAANNSPAIKLYQSRNFHPSKGADKNRLKMLKQLI
ncbi:MAG: GNAT family N-acetyltransferase [Fidelibacterota bacterium]